MAIDVKVTGLKEVRDFFDSVKVTSAMQAEIGLVVTDLHYAIKRETMLRYNVKGSAIDSAFIGGVVDPRLMNVIVDITFSPV